MTFQKSQVAILLYGMNHNERTKIFQILCHQSMRKIKPFTNYFAYKKLVYFGIIW